MIQSFNRQQLLSYSSSDFDIFYLMVTPIVTQGCHGKLHHVPGQAPAAHSQHTQVLVAYNDIICPAEN